MMCHKVTTVFFTSSIMFVRRLSSPDYHTMHCQCIDHFHHRPRGQETAAILLRRCGAPTHKLSHSLQTTWTEIKNFLAACDPTFAKPIESCPGFGNQKFNLGTRRVVAEYLEDVGLPRSIHGDGGRRIFCMSSIRIFIVILTERSNSIEYVLSDRI